MAGSVQSIHSQDVQDQVILPLRVAAGICLNGIRTRLGRSAVTLSGIALGIAFLMAVLCGFHVKYAMRGEAGVARDIDRRMAALRGSVGMLKGKTLAIVLRQGSETDQGFARSLVSSGATVLAPDGLTAEGGGQADAVVLLGRCESELADGALSWLRGKPVSVFDKPSAQTAERVAASGGRLEYLGIELRPDEVARARRRETQERSRMYWIAAVSLLITMGCIASAMLMSVTERFREIGTMKCLGALSSFVVKLFLIESLILGLVGAALGSIAGGLFSLLAYSYTFGFTKVFAAVDFATLGLYAVLGVAAGVVLAIVAAIYPARVAARMIPATALASHV